MSTALGHHQDREKGSQETSRRRYWIAHSGGFRVDGPGGRIGIVEEVRDDDGEPLLAVRAGLLGRRLLLIPAAEVFEILPRATRIWLRTPVSIAGSEPLHTAEPDRRPSRAQAAVAAPLGVDHASASPCPDRGRDAWTGPAPQPSASRLRA